MEHYRRVKAPSLPRERRLSIVDNRNYSGDVDIADYVGDVEIADLCDPSEVERKVDEFFPSAC